MYKEFDLSIMILRALLSANAVEVIRLNSTLLLSSEQQFYSEYACMQVPLLGSVLKFILVGGSLL